RDVLAAVAFAFAPAPRLLTAHPVGLGLSPIGFRNLHAVGPHRTSHEDPVAHEPRMLAAESVEALAARAVQVERLALLEHLLLQLPPVLVPLLERLCHELVEVGLLRRGKGLAGEQDGGDDQNRAHVDREFRRRPAREGSVARPAVVETDYCGGGRLLTIERLRSSVINAQSYRPRLSGRRSRRPRSS